MAQPPTGPPPSGPPPSGPPPSGPPSFEPPSFELPAFEPPSLEPTELDQTGRDRTDLQPPSAIRSSPSRWSRLMSEDAFQSLRNHLASLAWAVLIAAPAGFAVFFALGALRFAVDDRTLWNSVAHSIVQFWFVLVVFVLVAIPPALVLVRRGRHEAAAFLIERGYGKALLVVFLVIPAVAAIVSFVIGHIVIVLIVLAVLFVILVSTGGF